MGDSRLTQWRDSELGSLAWDDAHCVWVGRTNIAGRDVRLEIDPDRKEPTRDEQLIPIEPARALLARVKAEEPQLRRQASEQIADEVGAPKSEIDRFVATMVLKTISLHGSGELHYRNEEFFPGELVTVYFDEDLSNVEAEVYEA